MTDPDTQARVIEMPIHDLRGDAFDEMAVPGHDGGHPRGDGDSCRQHRHLARALRVPRNGDDAEKCGAGI